jgi:nitroreductase
VPFEQDKVKEVLGIPETARVVEVMTLGYPADTPGPRKRKPLEEIVCYEAWS